MIRRSLGQAVNDPSKTGIYDPDTHIPVFSIDVAWPSDKPATGVAHGDCELGEPGCSYATKGGSAPAPSGGGAKNPIFQVPGGIDIGLPGFGLAPRISTGVDLSQIPGLNWLMVAALAIGGIVVLRSVTR